MENIFDENNELRIEKKVFKLSKSIKVITPKDLYEVDIALEQINCPDKGKCPDYLIQATGVINVTIACKYVVWNGWQDLREYLTIAQAYISDLTLDLLIEVPYTKEMEP